MAKKDIIKHDCVKQIIFELASKLKVKPDEENNEACFDIPKKLGNGYFKAIDFDFGVGIIMADFLLKKELELSFGKESINPLKILFNLETPILFKSENKDENSKINRLESVMFSASTNETHFLSFEKSKPTTFFCIHINRKVFEPKIEQFINDMSEDLETLFRDLNGINHFFHKAFYTLEIAALIEQFRASELTDFMQSVFLEGKTYEVLTQYLQQFTDDLNEPDKQKLLRKATVNKIEEAVEIIKKELDVRISVNVLAKRVCLNQNTLQNGFKQLFKTSVNEYIRDHKIERAKTLLENSDLNITEITYKIGINSRSYFSKLFKERYGLTPKQYLTQSRKATKSA